MNKRMEGVLLAALAVAALPACAADEVSAAAPVTVTEATTVTETMEAEAERVEVEVTVTETETIEAAPAAAEYSDLDESVLKELFAASMQTVWDSFTPSEQSDLCFLGPEFAASMLESEYPEGEIFYPDVALEFFQRVC